MIKRYSYVTDCGINEDPDGDYVKYDDYKWLSDYADRLVELGKLPCLPADLENLREANAALAMEVHTLREALRMIRDDDHREKSKDFIRRTGNAFQYTPTTVIQFGGVDKVPFVG